MADLVAQADAYLAELVARRAHVPAPRLPGDPCLKCEALPEERCANAHDEGGICIRRLPIARRA